MDTMDVPALSLADNGHQTAKRKRSLSADTSPAPTKVAKSHNSHLHINYLSRQFSDFLPLISIDDTLPTLLALIQDYDGVLQRHESLAGNLGAKPLGPILIKRFERLFDGPPRVLKSNGREGSTIGWLDVVEFAKNKPEQFNLEKTRDGVRVCQFYTKQCRVEITEEDYDLIASGMPEKLIPQQPIVEDEEKELGTLEILEKNVAHILQLSDQLAGRARQLNNRLRSRQKAINSRREADQSCSPFSPRSSAFKAADMGQSAYQTNGDARTSMSPASGFTAVNSRQTDQSNGNTSSHGASAAIRAELLSKFFTTTERAVSHQDYDPSRRASNLSASRPRTSDAKTKYRPAVDPDNTPILKSASPYLVPIPNTPSSLLPYVKPSAADRFDDSGPYKAEMVSRMELLQRGDRVQPPCDRCRRLHMDCLKNLTACLGCTRKHAKCSWKEVTDDELRDYIPPASRRDEMDDGLSERFSPQRTFEEQVKRDAAEGVRDEELLGEEESDDSMSDSEVSKPDGRYSPIQVHVAGSVQGADGAPVDQDDRNGIDAENKMEPEVKRDIAKLQKKVPETLPSPPGAPIPPPATLPDLPSVASEAPPASNIEEQKDLVPKMISPPASYDSREYGPFSSINGNGAAHGLPSVEVNGSSHDEEASALTSTMQPVEVVYPSIAAPVNAVAPMAAMMGSSVGRTEA